VASWARVFGRKEEQRVRITTRQETVSTHYVVETSRGTVDAYLVRLGPHLDEWHVFVVADGGTVLAHDPEGWAGLSEDEIVLRSARQ
jgi:hypothetical protein